MCACKALKHTRTYDLYGSNAQTEKITFELNEERERERERDMESNVSSICLNILIEKEVFEAYLVVI